MQHNLAVYLVDTEADLVQWINTWYVMQSMAVNRFQHVSSAFWKNAITGRMPFINTRLKSWKDI